MSWLNYHHLYYFWCVVKDGGLAGASRRLRLAQSTISGQVRALETSFGLPLFERTGRRLRLTDTGQVVYRYASEIFSLGQELSDTVAGRTTGRPVRAAIGVSRATPELLARQLIAPAFHLREPLQLSCRRQELDALLADLRTHAIDVVIADVPAGPEWSRSMVTDTLLQTDIVLVGSPELEDRYRRGFPRSLTGAPMLLPAKDTAMRRAVDQWLNDNHIPVNVVCEYDDNGLMETFGEAGIGLFPTYDAIREEVCRRLGVISLGRLDGARASFYGIHMQRRTRNPVVHAIAGIGVRPLGRSA